MKHIRRWFTFVELIVSISIIAILWTIWIISFNSYGTTTRDTARISHIQDINVRLNDYKVKSRLPEPAKSIEVLNNTTSIAQQWELSELLMSTIWFQKILKDPQSEQYYTYTRSANKKYFQVMALLENKENIPKKASIEYENNNIQADNFPYSWWNKLGILTNEKNIPIEKELSQWTVNINNLETPLVAHLENHHFTYWTWAILASLEETNKKWWKFCKINSQWEITCWVVADRRQRGTGLEAIEWKQAIWYNDLPSNIQDIFDRDLPYVQHWKDNDCIKENIEVVEISPTNFKQKLCNWNWNESTCQSYDKQEMLENKIYVFEPWVYEFDSWISIHKTWEWKTCNAIIGQKWETIFKSDSRPSRWILNAVTRWHIIYGINIDAQTNGWSTIGIKFSDMNITVMNVEVTNATHWFEANTSNQNSGDPWYFLAKNIKLYNNDTWILIDQQDNFIISNADIYNNRLGLELNFTNTSITNLNIFNNDKWILFNGWNGVMNNSNIFNNTDGIYVNWWSWDLTFNGLNIYKNNKWIHLRSNRNYTAHNIHLHENIYGLYNYTWRVYYYGYLNSYNNTYENYNRPYNGYLYQWNGSSLFSNGIEQNSDKVWKAIPNMTWWNQSVIWQWSFWDLQGFSFEEHTPKQTRPLKNDATSPSYYGEDRGNMYDYISDYYVGQWD